MTPQEFATHTYQREIHRLEMENARLRARMHEAYDLAKGLAEENGQLREKIETITAAQELTHKEPRPDDVLPLPHLRLWREAKGMLQGDLAWAAGMYQKDVSWIERGKKMAYRTTAEKLAAALGITLEELLGGPP